MERRNLLMGMWCGPVAIVLFVIGLWFVAGLVPPPSPAESAEQIAAMYRAHSGGLRVGLAVVMMAAALTVPFAAAIAAQMRRIEGERGLLASVQYAMGVAGVFVIILPAMIMQAAAFRPDRDPAIIQALNDLAWLMFLGIISLFMVQCGAIAICVLQGREQSVFPRWVGYFNVWAALLVLPALLMYFFKTGPVAWNGVLVFWVGFTVLGLWFAAMSVALRNAIRGTDEVVLTSA